MNRTVLLVMWIVAALLSAACAPSQPESVTVAASATPALTAVPTSTDTPQPQPTVIETPTLAPTLDPNLTLTPPIATIEPVFGTNLEAPINITLPDGWVTVTTNAALPLPEGDTFSILPFAAYRGPVSGGAGTGYITLVWGFQNVVSGIPIQGTPAPVDLWADGLRLLLFALLEPDCNVGRDPKQEYRVGPYTAVGGAFWAVDCGDSSADDDIAPAPDVQGWFAGFKEGGFNFMFYAYVEPRESIVTAQGELQAILDSVTMDFSKLEESLAATPTP